MKTVLAHIMGNEPLKAKILKMILTEEFRAVMDFLEEQGQPTVPVRATPETIIQFSAIEHWRRVGRAECIQVARNMDDILTAPGKEHIPALDDSANFFAPDDLMRRNDPMSRNRKREQEGNTGGRK